MEVFGRLGGESQSQLDRKLEKAVRVAAKLKVCCYAVFIFIRPAVTVYSSTGDFASAGFYLRVEGHVDANSSTYEGGILHHFDIVHNDNNTGQYNTYFEFVEFGSSGPSEANSSLSFN